MLYRKMADGMSKQNKKIIKEQERETKKKKKIKGINRQRRFLKRTEKKKNMRKLCR